VGVELGGPGGLSDGKLALVKKTKNQVQLQDYSDRGSTPSWASRNRKNNRA